MTAHVFSQVANYIWPSAKYTYSATNGAFGGITTMWNLDKVVDVDISFSTHFVVTNFTTHSSNWTTFNFYAPNAHNGGLAI